MDIASIPKAESVVLMGLDFSMRPENVRYEASNGFITPLPANIVMHKIKSLALMVYDQEKLTPLYHANVCEESNPLAYFLCAMHRQSSPQSQKQKQKSRHTSTSSDASATSKASSCASSKSGNSCTLPRLVTSSVLPLGYWDSLYYALVAEIRLIYNDLQDKFGWTMEHGLHPLHYCGINGKTAQPVTAVDLAAVLEAAWYGLMDNRLVAALDDAVRMRKLHSSMRECDGDSENIRPPIVDGLVDVNDMEPEKITAMLWEKHAREIDQACASDFEDESMLTTHRAELNAQAVKNTTHAMQRGTPRSPSCRCRGRCICHFECDEHAGQCTCVPREQISFQTEASNRYGETWAPTTIPLNTNSIQQMETYGGEDAGYVGEMEVKENHAPVFNGVHRPQGDAMSSSFERKLPSRYRNRPRTDTDTSDLAYVPDGKPLRSRSKDMYPLGFYADGSPGRYPKIRNYSKMAGSEDRPANTTMRTLTRKPVPAPLDLHPAYQSPDASYGVMTPPSDDRYIHARAQAAYAENARLSVILTGKKDCVPESFPVTADNPRRANDSDPFVDSSSPINPANDYVGLLDRHPSSYDQKEQPIEPFPQLSRAATTTPPRVSEPIKSSSSRTRLPSLKSFSGDTSRAMPPLPPMPDLPLPDFINPRPALVQRYVSAGGNLPLAARTEVQGPAFHTTGFNTPAGVMNHSSGAGTTKAEIEVAMNNPEWVKERFGPEAVPYMGTGSTPPKSMRTSEESLRRESGRSTRNVGAGSQRPSVEKQTTQVYNPRDRTSSGVSSTKVKKAKFMRVFSRKHSGTEFD